MPEELESQANALATTFILKDQNQEGEKGVDQPLASQPLPLLRHQVERAVSHAGWSSNTTSSSSLDPKVMCSRLEIGRP